MEKNNTQSSSPKHLSEICRLNRALGQIEGIKKMIVDDRYCIDIITQLKAVRAALKNIESNVLATHMQNCLEKAILKHDRQELTKKVSEIRELIKKFD